MAPRSGRASPVKSETSVDLPAPLRPTSAWHSPARTTRDTSTRARVSPNAFDTFSASPTGAGAVAGPVDEYRCIGRFSFALLVVAPQVGAVDLGRAGIAGERHERRGQRVLEVALHVDDRTVVVR